MNNTNGINADVHMHTAFSSDSSSTVESMVEKAILLGLKYICITDHNDYGYPEEDGKPMFQLDVGSYIPKLQAIQQSYAGRIQIGLGLEQGLMKSVADKVNNFYQNNNISKDTLDFIIGSSHMVKGEDPYYSHYWEGKDIDECILYYFESILENIECCNEYDVYGHLDYIVRYVPDKSYHYQPERYSDIITAIFEALIKKDKGIELNTAGLKYGLVEPNPCSFILKRYYECGGRIITVGADGHKPEHIAYDFDKVAAILKQCGFKSYCIYKKRQPVFIPLP